MRSRRAFLPLENDAFYKFHKVFTGGWHPSTLKDDVERFENGKLIDKTLWSTAEEDFTSMISSFI